MTLMLESRTLASLLKTMASISITIPTTNLPRRSATIRNLSRHSATTPEERVTDTARLARLNLAVHGLSGDIKQGNTYSIQSTANRIREPFPVWHDAV